MRALFALTLAALVVTAVECVSAADLPSHGLRGSAGIGSRAAPLVVYDYEPGVMVRAYFRSPWRNRRYFPTGDQAPVLGRDEVIPGPDREMPEPAQSYYRFWSTS